MKGELDFLFLEPTPVKVWGYRQARVEGHVLSVKVAGADHDKLPKWLRELDNHSVVQFSTGLYVSWSDWRLSVGITIREGRW